ncbi:hypothetical protein [Ramlibacter sp. AN1133]|uniref:hypothetical protein n=1 Tax=Ramlibacter sp. AN1133 TaxID=3133429 RepID=UPI0030BA3CA0
MRGAGVFLLAAGWACAAAAGAPAVDERLAVDVTSEVSTGGLDYPSGVPVRESMLGVRYRADGWAARLELPWRRVAGLADVATPPVPGSRAADQGVGEARLKLVVPLREAAPGAIAADLVLRLQTGSGLAVGGVDMGAAGQSMGVSLRRPAGDWNLFGYVGWRRAGTLPGTDPGRNAWQGELGAWRMVGARIEAGGYASWRQAVGGDAMLPEATLYTALAQGDHRWQAYVRRAFTPGFPDLSAGVSYRASF